MPEILLQSALAASKSKQLADQAAQIRSNCRAQHGENTNTDHDTHDTKSLLTCPECYAALLEALRSRYQTPSSTDTQQQPQQPREWFAPRRAFLTALDLVITAAKEYQVSPQAVDDCVSEERARWYAERVRGSLLRLMVEDAASGPRAAVFEKLEDLAAATTAAAATGAGAGTGAGVGDAVALAREVAEILSQGALGGEEGLGDVSGRLAAAEGEDGRMGLLSEVFFAGEDGSVPEDHQKYLDLMVQQGLTMEQVVDRILEERQAAVGAREQTNKLSQRLDELRRARTAHELQKSRKAERRESLAQQKVPDELYEFPACAVCGGAPSPAEFFSCGICIILAGQGVRQEQTVFCSRACEAKGQASHAETHLCSSSSNCLLLPQNRKDNPTQEQPPSLTPNQVRFCTECLTSIKQPTLWCSLACADADFQQHREEVHLPERRKLGMDIDDEDQLEYFRDSTGDNDSSSSPRRYRPKNIGALTTSLEEAAKEWEERNKVRLQGLD